MARAGYGVLTDDVLVIEAGKALAGPRCLDLRQEAAAHFDFGEPLGMVGNRERWRVPLGPATPTTALGGWITLKWAEEVLVKSVPFAQRIARLTAAKGMLSSLAGGPVCWLDFAALPLIEFSRPKRWSDLDEAMALLLASLPGPS